MSGTEAAAADPERCPHQAAGEHFGVVDRAVVVVVLAALGLCLGHVFQGWDHTVLDHHGFRQSQTALAIHYLLEGGPWVAYETPVFGAPWSVPMEFPTYQLITAAVVHFTGVRLEPAGRAVGVLFYVVAMYGLWALFGELRVRRTARLVPVALAAVSPMLLFWSRTLMIESAAVGLGVLYLLFVARHLARPGSRWNLAGAALFGVLVALTKITTLVSFGLLVGALLAVALGRRWVSGGLRRGAEWLGHAPLVLCAGVLPLAAGAWWVGYADHLKQLNPMANGFLTSVALEKWHYGTWAQKLDWTTWQKLLASPVSLTVGHYAVLVLVLLALLAVRRHRAMIVLALSSYFLVFAVFTNLYFVHDYYGCGNAVALIVSVSLVVAALLEAPRRAAQGLGVLVLALLVAVCFARYRADYLPLVARDVDYFDDVLGAAIRSVTTSDEVVLIYGNDWSSAIPYGARRRALMDPWNLPLDHPKMDAALAATGRDRITAMVICGIRTRNRPFIAERVRFFGFEPEGWAVRQCTVYSKRPPPG